MKTVAFFLVFAVVFAAGCMKKTEIEQPAAPTAEEAAITEETMFAEDMTPLQTEETKIVVTENQTQPQNAQAVTAGTAFKKPTVEEMQKALQNAGFYRGKIDGKSGPMTKKAIEEFQAQNGLKADGKAGPKTWGKLKPYLAGTAVKK